MFGACTGDSREPLLVRSYPLEAGWVWHYIRTLDVELVGYPGVNRLADSAWVETRGRVLREGRPVFELVSHHRLGSGLVESCEFFHQDEEGLTHFPALGPGSDLAVYPKPGSGAGVPPAPSLSPLPTTADSGAADPRLVLAYPLRFGNSWVASRRPDLVIRQMMGEETIDVPAGRFRTARIHTTVYGDPAFEFDDWLAPVGLVRRRVDLRVDDFLFPGNPAPEHVIQIVELIGYRRPGTAPGNRPRRR